MVVHTFKKLFLPGKSRKNSTSVDSDPFIDNSVSTLCAFLPGARDCVFCIDASGSMFSGDYPPSRLQAAMEAACAFVDELRGLLPSSRIGTISFGSQALIDCPLTPVKKTNLIKKRIRAITDKGGTELKLGIDLCKSLLERSKPVSQIVVLSDGHSDSDSSLYSLVKHLKQKVIIECVGIGQQSAINETLLKEVASSYPDGSKRYRWIGDKQTLVEHFKTLAGGLSRQ